MNIEKTGNNLEGGKFIMVPPETQEFLKEEEEIEKEVAAVGGIIEKSRGDLNLTDNVMENPQWRYMVAQLNKTPEGEEILAVLDSLEDEILSIMKKFFNGEKKLEKVIALLVHAHREIKRMREQGSSGK
ncbi:MAG: hypothetical protein HYT37_02670 [Candidatus Sungbacteria bacterium]|nr:hypothetical protein [Candidatus Sungbacteria bacterium]